MRRVIGLLCLFIFLSVGGIFLAAGTIRASQPDGTDQSFLRYCSDETLKVRLLCSRDWAVEEHEDALFMVISEDPVVTLTISKIKPSVKFLGQLNKTNLEAIGQYQQGFQVEEVSVGKEKALKVKAFSKTYPEIRLLDYYFVHDAHLYGLLFSVDPKEEWEHYQFLIQKIANSFEFHEESTGESDHIQQPL